MSTLPLFLAEDLGSLPAVGGPLELTGPEGRHAATVKRIRPGEHVSLSDGRGAVAEAVAGESGRDSLMVDVGPVRRVAVPAVRVAVAQALVKGDRGELAVETATEAGADEVLPWRAARCVARWESGPRGEKALARWRTTVREAAKQARRPWIPDVAEPVDTAALARRIADADLALVLHESAAEGLRDVALPAAGTVLLVVGPEGGIDDRELDALIAAGARTVRMGPEVLRASTAACVALGALGVLTGRWARDTESVSTTPSTVPVVP
ncbi:16S rRNA (uracil1498-N3)-methyltransferase [Pseudonocardia sediminis]|uniref:Ribosomal RNA small subunit methyltransferase E n=1 Tax=Pseudonocardia sediminis TaxID=1397368 RepID=A0A4Q7V4F5_PSEST|nr:16S rRNA (uracil1498-N3)-methyltransferase [Pseudonocardia sediminis]